MGLNCCRLFGLRKDLEQICIRQKIESSELLSLLLEVTSQFSLDSLQILVGFLEALEQTVLGAHFDNLEHFVGLLHGMFPG